MFYQVAITFQMLCGLACGAILHNVFIGQLRSVCRLVWLHYNATLCKIASGCVGKVASFLGFLLRAWGAVFCFLQWVGGCLGFLASLEMTAA